MHPSGVLAVQLLEQQLFHPEAVERVQKAEPGGLSDPNLSLLNLSHIVQ